MKKYTAPWSASLMVMTSVATVLCLGISAGMLWKNRGLSAWLALIPMAIVFGGALFAIAGYSIGPDSILVHRLFWTTRLPLAGLRSARFEPDAMRWSIRTFGNGGLFSFSGFFRNKALGSYRAFVTDPHQTVVLRFANRIVVLSPSQPQDFVQRLEARIRGS